MSNNANTKQMDILRFIYDNVREHGYPPTVREICKEVGLSSTSTVHGHLSRLEKKGFISKDPTKPRALEVTPAGINFLGLSPETRNKEIPLLGVVAAGEPILAVQEATDYFPIPDSLAQNADSLFMLTISGTSMINIGILDGDQVIVRRQHNAENGEIVIAMNDEGEATCKRFFKESDHFRLQPENDTMAPIILKSCTILGKVVGLYRSNVN
ncbi:repressor LexA [Fructilactobacillus sanfranciscensis]|uniref:transcriptional repressor LexA n=1 Tax=Fructilactobacillus sanfranciscensis TaxID=1625 RepID=UPI000CD3FCE4|nr:transcriptional repressor LexA [Fructilactobacillus sanfranciscensis]MDN4461761.1 transcriptional repressor LexA [Fructilactobacillus sanfranciscensis]NDR61144.1 transcriptional repressor LexA [Fructilactobacillus sanfranciscensis]POH09414.1 repressor LexA [Fructilactobacillus sanfranciscensis]POH11473.1 repressor LexA [Fructilactobacillus sanfranciscensis]POH12870.1 repressor LexA [Fructilactobacillus sanfranciscensis]